MQFLFSKAILCFSRLSDFIGFQGVRLYLWAPVFFGAGAAFYFGLEREPLWTYGVFGTLLSGFLLYDCRRASLMKAAAAGLFLFAAGFAVAQARTTAVSTPAVKHRLKTTLVRGTVEESEIRPDGKGRIVLTDVSVDGLLPESTPRRIRLTVSGPLPDDGALIAVKALLSPPSAPLSATGYDDAFTLYFRKIGAKGSARGEIEILRPGKPSPRRKIRNRIMEILPDESGAVAAALATGDKSALSEKTANVYRTAGIAHLLAVSGLHLGLIAGFVFWLVRSILSLVPAFALRFSTKKAAAGTALIAAFGYLLLSGAPVSAVRAFVMISFALSAVFFDRKALSAASIAWAAMLILIARPEALTEAGFQLSFAAAAALIALSESGLFNRLPFKAVTGVLPTAAAASIATAPFAAFCFKRLAVWTLAGNLATSVIAAFCVMPALFASLVLMPFGADAPFLKLAGYGIDLITAAAERTAALPHPLVLVPAMPFGALIAAGIGELWFFLIKGRIRLLGLIPFTVAFIVPYVRPVPVMIVSQNVIAFREQDGRLSFNAGKGSRFVRDTLLSDNAQSDETQIRCDLCVMERDGKMFAAARTKKASEKACAEKEKYAVLYAKTGCGRRFPSDGSESVYFSAGKIRIEKTGSKFRPWTPAAR